MDIRLVIHVLTACQVAPMAMKTVCSNEVDVYDNDVSTGPEGFHHGYCGGGSVMDIRLMIHVLTACQVAPMVMRTVCSNKVEVYLKMKGFRIFSHLFLSRDLSEELALPQMIASFEYLPFVRTFSIATVTQ